MSPTQQLQAFVQSVYLVIKGRYFDDLTSDDGVNLINQTIDWANQYIDELETETNPDGSPIDWVWSRETDVTLGTAVAGQASITTPKTINNLIADETRYVQVLQDGTAVSNWAVVSPNDISSKTDRITEDMCAVVGDNIVFSRVFNDAEDGGTITGDVTTPLPRMSTTNIKALNIVKPKTLLILGVAKNASLPDIVQGGLSPSYAQKYNDLLQGAIARNNASAVADTAARDNFTNISGVGF